MIARKNKPWAHSTGPVTEAGKQASARNARKHGFDGREMAKILANLRLQRLFVKLHKP